MALGVVVGAGLTLLFRRGPSERPAARLARAARSGATHAGRYGLESARWAARRGERLLDNLSLDDVRDTLGAYLDSAREAIDDAVSREVKDLRKAIRRQRKRLGV
jgi:hypothetical protein